MAEDIYGSYNGGENSSGGDNRIINSGTVSGSIFGSYNSGDNATSTGNTIINSGTVAGNIYGSYNSGSGASGGDDSITNSGTVGGGIYAEDGNDTVIMESGSDLVEDVIDGGDGTDTIIYGGGTWIQGDSKVVNFEDYEVIATGDLILSGEWDIGPKTAQVDSGSLTVSDTLAGGSLITQSGTTTTISGTATMSSSTSLGGDMYLNGTLNSPTMTIDSGGMLYGTGTINGDLTIYGGISPGNSIGTIQINSTLTFEDGSIYYAELDSSGGSDLISTSGSVNINGGSVSTSVPQAFYYDGFAWTLVSARDGVSGNFTGIDEQLDSETLSLATVNQGDALELQISRKSFGDFAETVGGKAAGENLDAIVYQAWQNDDNMAAFIENMDWNYSASDIRDAMEALSPEMYTAFTAAGLNSASIFAQASTLRMSELRRAAMAGSSMQNLAMSADNKWGGWARYLTGKECRDGDNDSLSHNQTVTGWAAGTDVRLFDWLQVGFSAGLSQGDLDWDGRDSSGDQSGLHLGLYGQAAARGYFLNASAAYSDFDNDASRRLVFRDVSATASSSFGSSAFLWRVEGGYDYAWQSWLFSPTASLRYTHLKEDGFSESGADFLNLTGGERSSDSFVSALGLRTSTQFNYGENTRLIPRLGLFWLHEFMDDAPTISAGFRDYSDTLFSTSGISPDQDRMLVEAGFESMFSDTLSATIDYNMDWGQNSLAQTVAVGIDIVF